LKVKKKKKKKFNFVTIVFLNSLGLFFLSGLPVLHPFEVSLSTIAPLVPSFVSSSVHYTVAIVETVSDKL